MHRSAAPDKATRYIGTWPGRCLVAFGNFGTPKTLPAAHTTAVQLAAFYLENRDPLPGRHRQVGMAASVDAKLLRTTKFPPEFNQKVDMQKVNLQVMKK